MFLSNKREFKSFFFFVPLDWPASRFRPSRGRRARSLLSGYRAGALAVRIPPCFVWLPSPFECTFQLLFSKFKASKKIGVHFQFQPPSSLTRNQLATSLISLTTNLEQNQMKHTRRVFLHVMKDGVSRRSGRSVGRDEGHHFLDT